METNATAALGSPRIKGVSNELMSPIARGAFEVANEVVATGQLGAFVRRLDGANEETQIALVPPPPSESGRGQTVDISV